MSAVKQTILAALTKHRGDDLYRAQSAFRNCTPAQMTEQYGQSGQTRQEIIDEYQQYDNEVLAAIQWVENNIP